MRKEFCEKDGIRITYSEDNICFEDMKTADSVLIDNEGKILFSNYDESKTKEFVMYFNKIYESVKLLRELDSLEVA